MDTSAGGKGKLKYPDGSEYEGQFRNNQKHGKGVMRWPNGEKTYDGEWENDTAKGYGTFTWQEGERTVIYTGEVENSEPSGLGDFKYKKCGAEYKVSSQSFICVL
jgi:hypothetical protein